MKPNPSSRSSFDVTSDPDSGSDAPQNSSEGGPTPNPFLGINFNCCRSYARIYRNREGTAYVGNCPKCGARVKVPIGNGGSSSRFFNAQ